MSSVITRILMMSIIAILGSCATTNKVTQDYKPDTDFRPYKTFSWHNYSSDVISANQVAIQRAVEQQLSQQGFTLVSGLSDLVLDMTIIKQAASTRSSSLGLSIGLPLGRHGSIGLGTSKLLGEKSYTEALVILDITAQETHQILWRGTAENIPLSDFTLQNQVKLNARLRDLLQQFPPKTAK